jgi:hypothetical protein
VANGELVIIVGICGKGEEADVGAGEVVQLGEAHVGVGGKEAAWCGTRKVGSAELCGKEKEAHAGAVGEELRAALLGGIKCSSVVRGGSGFGDGAIKVVTEAGE